MRRTIFTAFLLLGGCTAQTPHVRPAVEIATGWKAELSAEDDARIADMDATWRKAIAAVPVRGRKLLTQESGLLSPDAARTHPGPPPGSYRCRLLRIGAPAIKSFPDNFCYVRAEAGNALSFTKQTGSELPGGWLHEDGDRRLVFVGARQKAPSDNSMLYGTDPERDLAGVLERIGPFRWRLVLPWRTGKPGLDVYEMTPVPTDQQVAEPPVPESKPGEG